MKETIWTRNWKKKWHGLSRNIAFATSKKHFLVNQEENMLLSRMQALLSSRNLLDSCDFILDLSGNLDGKLKLPSFPWCENTATPVTTISGRFHYFSARSKAPCKSMPTARSLWNHRSFKVMKIQCTCRFFAAFLDCSWDSRRWDSGHKGSPANNF